MNDLFIESDNDDFKINENYIKSNNSTKILTTTPVIQNINSPIIKSPILFKHINENNLKDIKSSNSENNVENSNFTEQSAKERAKEKLAKIRKTRPKSSKSLANISIVKKELHKSLTLNINKPDISQKLILPDNKYILIVGDIHGDFDKFFKPLVQAGFIKSYKYVYKENDEIKNESDKLNINDELDEDINENKNDKLDINENKLTKNDEDKELNKNDKNENENSNLNINKSDKLNINKNKSDKLDINEKENDKSNINKEIIDIIYEYSDTPPLTNKVIYLGDFIHHCKNINHIKILKYLIDICNKFKNNIEFVLGNHEIAEILMYYNIENFELCHYTLLEESKICQKCNEYKMIMENFMNYLLLQNNLLMKEYPDFIVSHTKHFTSKPVELKNCLIAATKYGQIGNKVSPRLRRSYTTIPYYFIHDENYKKLMEKYNKEHMPSLENLSIYKNEVNDVVKEVYEKYVKHIEIGNKYYLNLFDEYIHNLIKNGNKIKDSNTLINKDSNKIKDSETFKNLINKKYYEIFKFDMCGTRASGIELADIIVYPKIQIIGHDPIEAIYNDCNYIYNDCNDSWLIYSLDDTELFTLSQVYKNMYAYRFK